MATRVIRDQGKLKFEIEFRPASGDLVYARPWPEVLVQRGTVQNIHCEKLTKGARQVSFEVVPEGEAPVELSVCLQQAGQVVSETWRYLCPN